jgi:hypothetical protein
MKKAIITTKKMAIAFVAIFTIGFTDISFAQDRNDTSPLQLKYAGKFDEYPVFQLNVNNAEPDEFQVVIKDQFSHVLYSGQLKGAYAMQRYRLQMNDEELEKVLFEITSKKTKKNLVYVINKSTQRIEEISVAKL